MWDKICKQKSLELHIKFKHEEHKSMTNKINVCVWCKSQLNQDKLKTPCMDCDKFCCEPCVVDWISYINKKEKVMANAKQMGIIEDEIMFDTYICKGCFKTRCSNRNL